MVAAHDLNCVASKLRERVQIELDNYFPKATDHQLVALMCDPVMMTCAVPWLEANGYADDIERAHNLFLYALIEEAKRSLQIDVVNNESQRGDSGMAATVMDLTENEDEPNAEEVIGAPSDMSDNESDVDDVFDLPTHVTGVEATVTMVTTADMIAEKAFKLWTQNNLDFAAFLKDVQKVTLTRKDESKIQCRNWTHVSKLVDVQLWWRVYGHAHRLVERVAARELACPDSNGLQERVFSVCKLLDSPLRQSMGDSKFEMLLVLSFNKCFMHSAARGSLITTHGLAKALRSAASATQAAKCILDFFDLNESDDAAADADFVAMLRSVAQSTPAE